MLYPKHVPLQESEGSLRSPTTIYRYNTQSQYVSQVHVEARAASITRPLSQNQASPYGPCLIPAQNTKLVSNPPWRSAQKRGKSAMLHTSSTTRTPAHQLTRSELSAQWMGCSHSPPSLVERRTSTNFRLIIGCHTKCSALIGRVFQFSTRVIRSFPWPGCVCVKRHPPFLDLATPHLATNIRPFHTSKTEKCDKFSEKRRPLAETNA